MPAPITHTILALMALNSGWLPLHRGHEKEFIIGTNFPDIRYLGVIERSATHINPITWNDVCSESSPFKAGMKFHAFVDNARTAYPKAYCTTIKRSPMLTSNQFSLLLRCGEDCILYGKLTNWAKISSYFDAILEEERAFGINQEDLKRWHTFLKNYFDLQKWNSQLRGLFFRPYTLKKMMRSYYKELLSNNMIDDIVKTVLALEQDRDLKEAAQEFYINFSLLIPKMHS